LERLGADKLFVVCTNNIPVHKFSRNGKDWRGTRKVLSFSFLEAGNGGIWAEFSERLKGDKEWLTQVVPPTDPATVKNVITMDEYFSKDRSRAMPLRDRRYAIRFPFAADAEFLDLETGARSTGVTSDISLGGCFVCASKTWKVNTRVRITLSRKEHKMEALAMVRIVKPRVGMGIEFLDVDTRSRIVLERWIEQLRRDR
jgi:hypothetical protein